MQKTSAAPKSKERDAADAAVDNAGTAGKSANAAVDKAWSAGKSGSVTAAVDKAGRTGKSGSAYAAIDRAGVDEAGSAAKSGNAAAAVNRPGSAGKSGSAHAAVDKAGSAAKSGSAAAADKRDVQQLEAPVRQTTFSFDDVPERSASPVPVKNNQLSSHATLTQNVMQQMSYTGSHEVGNRLCLEVRTAQETVLGNNEKTDSETVLLTN